MAGYTPDELGELGQDAFRQRCSTERLHANPSDRDRTGWDFRVEQPNTALSKDALLDQRTMPEPVMVQVKAVSPSSTTIALKLRTFERLAKLHDPAFVVVPVINNGGQNESLWGIHIVGKALEKTLKRLAEIHAKGRGIGKNDTISFGKSKWWQPIPINGDNALTAYFEDEIKRYRGSASYPSKKELELENLGYEDQARYSMSVSFEAENEEQIFRGLLGLEPLQVARLKAYDHRFGLKRPADGPEFSRGEMTVEPTEESLGVLRLEHTESGELRDVHATWRAMPLPGQSAKNFRLLVSVQQLRVYLRPGGQAQVWREPIVDAKQPASAWAEMYEAFHALAVGGVRLSLLSEDYQPLLSIGDLASPDLSKDLLAELRAMKAKSKLAERVMRRISLSSLPLDLDDIVDEQSAFGDLESLATKGEISFTMLLPAEEVAKASDLTTKPHSIVIPGLLGVGSKHVAYAYFGEATGRFQDGNIRLNCRRKDDLEFQIVGNKLAYEEFIARVLRIRKPLINCSLDVPEFGPGQNAGDTDS